MQLLVTTNGKTITIQKMTATPVTPPADAQFIFEGSSLAGAMNTAADSIFSNT